MQDHKIQVVVIDMQPITPAVGGGRQRLYGLYHDLGDGVTTTYVGSYDWPGEPYRDQSLTPSLREIVVPLSDSHHEAASKLSDELDGRVVIDSAFSGQVKLSQQYLDVARRHIEEAHVVIFSHPWCYLPLAKYLRDDQVVIYDAHNVEALLRADLLGDSDSALRVREVVVQSEEGALNRADLVLVCSEEDADLFQRIYDIEPKKFRIAPNGAFVERMPAPSEVDRMALRMAHGLPADKVVGVFMGSNYGPNVGAANFIVEDLAKSCPETYFVIIGGVKESIPFPTTTTNVALTGEVEDRVRDEILLASDFALNPMDAGSGTNIKMFDFMAAGLPILTTSTGARGIATARNAPKGIFVATRDSFAGKCRELRDHVDDVDLKAALRRTADARFSWERISRLLGEEIKREYVDRNKGRKHTVALFSTWNIACGIGEHAARLAEALKREDTEVVVLGNEMDVHQPLGFERDLEYAVSRIWRWDNEHWMHSGIEKMKFRRTIRLAEPELLIIQHHSAYVPQEDIEWIITEAMDVGVETVIEMHDGRNVADEWKERFIQLGATLLAHHHDEVEGLIEKYPKHVQVGPLPVDFRPENLTIDESADVDEPVIGGFGFLRPYKGLMTSIQTIARLRQKYPKIRYRGWHAFYPGDESERYYHECMIEAERLGVSDAIEVDTRFLPIDQVMHNLSSVSMVLLPYDPSFEGGSAAANQAIASGRPVLTSPSMIFNSVENVVVRAHAHTANDYAALIDEILGDRIKYIQLRNKSIAWAESNSYACAATRLINKCAQSTIGFQDEVRYA